MNPISSLIFQLPAPLALSTPRTPLPASCALSVLSSPQPADLTASPVRRVTSLRALAPSHRTTANVTHKTQKRSFLGNCDAGSFYNLGTSVCEPCGHGFYQPTPGSFACLPCGVGKTTLSATATDEDECRDECPGSWVSRLIFTLNISLLFNRMNMTSPCRW